MSDNNILKSRFRFLNEFIEKQRKLLRSLSGESLDEWELGSTLTTGKRVVELLNETAGNIIPTLYRVGKLVRQGFIPSDKSSFKKVEEVLEESRLSRNDWRVMRDLQNQFRSQYKATVSTIGDLFDSYKAQDRLSVGLSQVENLGGTTIRTTGYSAFLHGIAEAEGPLDESTLCCKILMPNACRYCVMAYKDSKGYPKIFTIGELAANGDAINAGSLKKPVLGQLHYNCRCLLLIIPKGLSKGKEADLISRAEKDYSKLYYQLRKEGLTK